MKNNKTTYLYSSVFCLLLDNISKTYETAIKLIILECQKLNLCFNPKTVFADLEKATHVVISKVWQSVLLKGCRFHLG